MADETPKSEEKAQIDETAKSDETVVKPKVAKPATKRLSKGFRKHLRRRKEAARKPFGDQQ